MQGQSKGESEREQELKCMSSSIAADDLYSSHFCLHVLPFLSLYQLEKLRIELEKERLKVEMKHLCVSLPTTEVLSSTTPLSL